MSGRLGTSRLGTSTLGSPIPAVAPGFFEVDILAFLGTFGIVATPGKVPEGDPLPAVVFNRTRADRPTMLSGSSGMVEARCQLSVFSTDYLDCARISETLRKSLHGFRGRMGGTTISPALLDDQLYSYESNIDGSDAGTHQIINLYTFHFTETIP